MMLLNGHVYVYVEGEITVVFEPACQWLDRVRVRALRDLVSKEMGRTDLGS